MKGFFFRLERVLHLRATAERERARDLGQAVREETARREQLDVANARLDRLGDQVATAGSTTSAGALRNLNLSVQAAANDLESAAASHAAAADAVAANRQRFRDARRDRRVVERLREKRQEVWKLDVDRDAQKELDETVRRRAGGAR